MSWLYVFVIRERMAQAGERAGWEDFAADNPDLMRDWGAFVQRFYSPELLRSPLARREFVLPDRIPVRPWRGVSVQSDPAG